jgi:hypothetical protein
MVQATVGGSRGKTPFVYGLWALLTRGALPYREKAWASDGISGFPVL